MKFQLSRTGCVWKPLYANPPNLPIADPRLQQSWKDLSYKELAFEILSLYISSSEIPHDDLKAIIDRSYSTFRAEDVVPLVNLQDGLAVSELFHGPSFSFKDCMFDYGYDGFMKLTQCNVRRLAISRKSFRILPRAKEPRKSRKRWGIPSM